VKKRKSLEKFSEKFCDLSKKKKKSENRKEEEEWRIKINLATFIIVLKSWALGLDSNNSYGMEKQANSWAGQAEVGVSFEKKRIKI
jgi:hypothetical protein